ncbi:MAG: DUF2442 domain-containing protein [Chitinophagaceae bacterium]|nr:DUF2442 domain-containing protein [Chitinophagaceae bacterium]
MNKIIPYLKTAKALPNYQLMLEFEDGVKGTVDLSLWKGKESFKEWDDEKKFSSFVITKDRKIEWSEAIDMDPDSFYLKLINKTFEEYAFDKQLLRHPH